MEHELVQKQIAQRSAQIYIPLSVAAALFFLLAITLVGDYPLVVQIGGTIWVGLLSLIVSIPLVTAHMKRQTSGS